MRGGSWDMMNSTCIQTSGGMTHHSLGGGATGGFDGANLMKTPSPAPAWHHVQQNVPPTIKQEPMEHDSSAYGSGSDGFHSSSPGGSDHNGSEHNGSEHNGSDHNGSNHNSPGSNPRDSADDEDGKSDYEMDDMDEQSLRVPRINSHGKVKMFKCKQCEFVAVTKLAFWEHTRSHIKIEKLLTCPKCPFVTEYKHHLEYHLRNHFGSKPFKCDKCNYSCVNKSMLNSHLKSHSNIYQYRCADCTYASKYCHSLKLHLRKYKHSPAMVLNPDGTPNPLPIIDVYGTRRGPKQKLSKEEMQPLSPQAFNGLAANFPHFMVPTSQTNITLPFPYGPILGAFPSALANSLTSPLLFPQIAQPQLSPNPSHGSTTPELRVVEESPDSTVKTDHSHDKDDKADVDSTPKVGMSPGREVPSGGIGVLMTPTGEMQRRGNEPFRASTWEMAPKDAMRASLNQSVLMNTPAREVMESNNEMAPRPEVLSSRPEIPRNENFRSDILPSPNRQYLTPSNREVLTPNREMVTPSKAEEDTSTVLDLSKPEVMPISIPGMQMNTPAINKNRRKGRAFKLERLAIAKEVFSDEEDQQPEIENKSALEPVVELKELEVSKKVDDFRCQYCDITFGDVVMYTMHMGYHGYKDPFTCNMCGEQSVDKVSFFLHIARTSHS